MYFPPLGRDYLFGQREYSGYQVWIGELCQLLDDEQIGRGSSSHLYISLSAQVLESRRRTRAGLPVANIFESS